MFNALNRFISRLDGENPASLVSGAPGHAASAATHSFFSGHPGRQQGSSTNNAEYGFQVLKNTTEDLPMEPWFDFIVGINGRVLENPEPWLFAQEVRNCKGQHVLLTIWSAKGQRTRDVHVSVPEDTASLGLTLQWTSISMAAIVWHVLDVAANSPADVAGLFPYSDYIIGSPEGALYGESGLGELVEDHIARPLRLYVYNTDYDVTREVTLQPTRDWGGEGALGCVLGYGALHRIPAPLSEPVSGPGETMFENTGAADASFTPVVASGAGAFQPTDPDHAHDDDVFIPAASLLSSQTIPTATTTSLHESSSTATSLPPPPPPPPSDTMPGPPTASLPGRKKKERPHHAPGADFMDDYFKEQEAKSREMDNAPAGRRSNTATPLPPPPKLGQTTGAEKVTATETATETAKEKESTTENVETENVKTENDTATAESTA